MAGDKERSYAVRFQKVLDYINDNLDQDLSVERLSEVSNFSKFHFHRQFSRYCGISVGRYVLMMRLKRAAHRLAVDRSERMIDIALDAGFDTPESFSRAFKRVFKQTPSAFRRKPAWDTCVPQYGMDTWNRVKTMDVRIIDFESALVAVLEHRGSPERVNSSASRFIEWRKASGLSPVLSSATFGIVYDDPDIVAPRDFRFDICGTVAQDVPANLYGVLTKRIPGGRCAVVRHLGAHDGLGDCVYYLFRQWLPGSGEELRDFPVYFQYLNFKPETPEDQLITDVYLPLA